MNERNQIIHMLSSTDEEQRLQGLKELARQGAEQHLDIVYQSLGDESWRVRKEAVAIFLALPGVGSLAGEVVELLHAEENAGLRNAAVEILVGLGRQAVPALIDELHCADHDVRKFVLDVLGEIGDEGCIAAMVGALSDVDSNVRAAAAENLGKLRAAEATPALLNALEVPDLLLRFTVLEALGQIQVPLPVERLIPLAGERLLRKALYDCLGRLADSDAIPTLLEGLGDSMRNVRSAAAQGLSAVAKRYPEQVVAAMQALEGAPLLEQLVELLESPDITVRRAALQLLGWSRDPRFAPQLLRLFEDEALREDAAAALISFGVRANSVLLPMWHQGDDRTRAYLAYVFAAIGCTEALPLLDAALVSESPELRVMVLHALGKLGRRNELDRVVGSLLDESEEVREAATQALTQIGGRQTAATIVALKALLERDDGELRMRVVQILGRLGGDVVEPILVMALKDESPLVRRAAVQACGYGSSDRVLQSLLLVLTDEDQEVRRLTVEALGNCGNPQVVRSLTLALQDEDIWVRAAAVRALGRFTQDEAVQAVESALADPVGLVVIAAMETLVAQNQEHAQAPLVAALASHDEEVVSAALQLLTQFGVSDWIEEAQDRLINHRHWEVRVTFARILAAELGVKSRPMLEARLLVEGEDLVRQQIRDLLMDLQG